MTVASRLTPVDDDRFHDRCGLFGIFGHPEAAHLTYLGLYAQQHRGQESAGIVSSDGERLRIEKGMGLVNDIFTDDLGMPSIWIPHSYGSCSQHAPDEHILMPLSRSAAQLMAGLYWDIGEGKGVPPRA